MRNYGMEIDVNALTDEQLETLRAEIKLCSLFYKDYQNSLGVEIHSCCDFFDGYSEYLAELMENDGIDAGNEFYQYLEDYDNIENLSTYYNYIDFTELRAEQ